MLASEIIEDVARQLLDEDYTRWSLSEHYKNLTTAQRAVCMVRKDANAQVVNVLLTADTTRQAVPDGYSALIDIVRNMGADGATPGNGVSQVKRDSMDNSLPGWHAATTESAIEHYIYDDAYPLVFYVTPRPDAAIYVEAILCEDPATVTALTDTLDLGDIYAEPLREYCLYLAFSKDNDSGQDMQLAEKRLAAFYLLLGEEAKARAVLARVRASEVRHG